MTKQNCKCYCSELTNFWKEGNYTSKLFSVEGLEILSGTTKVEYLYKCCKIVGVKLTETFTFNNKPVTSETYYCCNGKIKFTDSLGSKLNGNWDKKCCNLVSYVCGIDSLLGNGTSKGKIVDMKDGNNYKSDLYKKECCDYNLKYRYTLTKI